MLTGAFKCNNNNLTSLENAPNEVKYVFDCSQNQLTSLEYAPKKMYSLYCANNQLTSLKGAPLEIAGNLDCSYNKLTSLKGCPIEIKGYFNSSNNLLTSLEDSPEIIETNIFVLTYNKFPEKLQEFIDNATDWETVKKMWSIYTSEKLVDINNKIGLFE